MNNAKSECIDLFCNSFAKCSFGLDFKVPIFVSSPCISALHYIMGVNNFFFFFEARVNNFFYMNISTFLILFCEFGNPFI